MTKHCSRCDSDKALTEFRKDASRRDGLYPYCASCLKEIGRDYRRRNPGKGWERTLLWRKRDPEGMRRNTRDSLRRYRAKLRAAVLQAYGGDVPACACCGESSVEFLAVDHIHGGGNAHRREIKATFGSMFYKWLVDNKFPAGFQLLCHNCNFAKGHYGMCPHQRVRTEVA